MSGHDLRPVLNGVALRTGRPCVGWKVKNISSRAVHNSVVDRAAKCAMVMAVKIGAMASLTGPAACRHGAGCAIRPLKLAVGFMAGGAGFMDQVVGGAYRDAGGRARSIRMAARAFGGGHHLGIMRYVGVAHQPVAVHAGAGNHGNDRRLGARDVGGLD